MRGRDGRLVDEAKVTDFARHVGFVFSGHPRFLAEALSSGCLVRGVGRDAQSRI